MKKTVFLLCILLVCVCSLPVYASDTDTLQELYEESGMAQSAEVLDDTTLTFLYAVGLDPKDVSAWTDADMIVLWEIFAKQIKEKWEQPAKLLASLIGMLLLSLLMQMLSVGTAVVPGDLFVTVVCGGLLGAPMIRLLRQIKAVFETANGFVESFLPAYAGILAATGQSAAAAGIQTVAFATASIVTKLMNELLLPAVSVYIALCFVSAAGDLIRTDEIAKAVSSAISWSLGIVMSFFTLTLSVQKLIVQSADSLGMKTAKLAVSTLIPVVGGQLSDALSTVTGCLQILKSSAGSFAVIALLLLFLPAVLSVIAILMVVKAGQITAILFHLDAAKRAFAALGSGVGLLLGIMLCAAAAMIISVAMLAAAMGG